MFVLSWNQLFCNFFSKNIDLTEKNVDFSVKIVIAFCNILPLCDLKTTNIPSDFEQIGFNMLLKYASM